MTERKNMYWEERLEWIKQTYHLKPNDLKTHWMQWNTIRENRHKGFIKHQVLETKVVIHPTAHYSYQQALGDLLHEQKNYWLELGGHEKGRYLFDCKSDVIDLLLRYSYGSNDCFPRFAIIDKKYTGLSI